MAGIAFGMIIGGFLVAGAVSTVHLPAHSKH